MRLYFLMLTLFCFAAAVAVAPRKIKLGAKMTGKKGKDGKEDACKKQKTGRASSRKRKGGAVDEVLI
jgi:hypothetical protein